MATRGAPVTIGEWVRSDLRKVNTPREIACTFRRYPMNALRVVLSFVLALVVIFALLTTFGHGDAFGDWWWLAGLWAGSSAGGFGE
jgi:hypothetical protein